MRNLAVICDYSDTIIIKKDKINHILVKLLKFYHHKQLSIIVIDEDKNKSKICMSVIIDNLKKYDIPYDNVFLGENSKDKVEIKAELLKKISYIYDPIIGIDFDKKVRNYYKSYNLSVINPSKLREY